MEGREFREVLGPGDCCAADSPRAVAQIEAARANADNASGAVQAPTAARAGAVTPGGAGTAAAGAAAAGAGGAGQTFGGLTVDGLSILKPPYGTIAAVNLDRGDITWRVAHGDTPDNVRNHPALKGLNIPKTGQGPTGGIGLMATKTLVVMGDPQLTTTPEHPRGAMLRAYDKTNGNQVGAVFMPAPQSGSPMTYLAGGRQYIVVAISGGNYSGEYLAFTLPR